MFSSRTLKSLIAILILLGGLWLVYMYFRVPHGKRPFQKMVKDAVAIEIKESNQTLRLQKAGEEWKAATANNKQLAIDAARMRTMLNLLNDVELEDVISERPAAADEFEANVASGAHVRVLGASDKLLAQGIFGKQAPDFTHIYFRYPDQPQIYLARGAVRGEVGPATVNEWRPKTVIDVAEADVEAISVQGPSSTVELAKSTTGWTRQGQAVAPEPVYQFLGAMAHLKPEEWITEGTAGAPTFDDLTEWKFILKSPKKTQELRVGKRDPKTKRFAASPSPEAGVAYISEASFLPLQLTPADFKAK